MTVTYHPTLTPLTELVRDLSPEAQALALQAITRVLNHAHHYDDRMDEARGIEQDINAREHSRPAPCIDTDGCDACWFVREEQIVLGAAERSKAFLEGRGP